MSFYNESDKFEGIRRYDEAGNPICSYKRFDKRYTQEKRNSLPIGYLIRGTQSKRTNPYYSISRRRGGTIAPNISNKEKEVEL